MAAASGAAASAVAATGDAASAQAANERPGQLAQVVTQPVTQPWLEF
jgi:hypothetical protein